MRLSRSSSPFFGSPSTNVSHSEPKPRPATSRPRRRSVLSTLRSDGCSTPSALLRPRGTVSTSRPSLARHRSRGSEAAVLGHVVERNGPQFTSDNSRGRLPTARSRPLTFEYVCRAESAMVQELVNPCPGTSLTLVPGGHRSALPTQPPSSSQECGWSPGASTPMTWSAHIGLPAFR